MQEAKSHRCWPLFDVANNSKRNSCTQVYHIQMKQGFYCLLDLARRPPTPLPAGLNCVELFVRVTLAVVATSSSSMPRCSPLPFFPPRPARLATCSLKQRAENPSIRTLHWSAVTAVISTVLLGKMRAKLLWAFAASHFCLRMEVPVNIGLSGSGLQA